MKYKSIWQKEKCLIFLNVIKIKSELWKTANASWMWHTEEYQTLKYLETQLFRIKILRFWASYEEQT